MSHKTYTVCDTCGAMVEGDTPIGWIEIFWKIEEKVLHVCSDKCLDGLVRR